MLKSILSMLAVLSVICSAQVVSEDTVEVITPKKVQAETARATGSAQDFVAPSTILASHGNVVLRLSVLMTSGEGEIHNHLDDLMIVQQGSATLITGGTLLERKDLPNGNSKGKGIRNGSSKTITVGDVILIPAGVPHQLLISPGTTYSALVAKIKEP